MRLISWSVYSGILAIFMASFFPIQNFKDKKLRMVENLAKKPGKEREGIYAAVYSNMFATAMVAS